MADADVVASTPSRAPLSFLQDFNVIYATPRRRLWACVHAETGQKLAIKAFSREGLESKRVQQVLLIFAA